MWICVTHRLINEMWIWLTPVFKDLLKEQYGGKWEGIFQFLTGLYQVTPNTRLGQAQTLTLTRQSLNHLGCLPLLCKHLHGNLGERRSSGASISTQVWVLTWAAVASPTVPHAIWVDYLSTSVDFKLYQTLHSINSSIFGKGSHYI